MPVAVVVLVPALILAGALARLGPIPRPRGVLPLAGHAAAAHLLAPLVVTAVIHRTAAMPYPTRELIVLCTAQLAFMYIALVCYWLARFAAECAAPFLRR